MTCFWTILSVGDVDKFNEVLSGLLDDLKDIIWLLSKGIHESQQHFMDKDFVCNFMCYIMLSSSIFLWLIQYDIMYIKLLNRAL